jgi:hypothetical protein
MLKTKALEIKYELCLQSVKHLLIRQVPDAEYRNGFGSDFDLLDQGGLEDSLARAYQSPRLTGNHDRSAFRWNAKYLCFWFGQIVCLLPWNPITWSAQAQ